MTPQDNYEHLRVAHGFTFLWALNLTLKAPNRTSADNVHKYFSSFSEKIRLDVSSESAEDSHAKSSLIFIER